MTRPKSDLTAHHIHLYAGDLEELGYLIPGMRPSRVVRELVRQTIEKLKANDPDVTELKVKVDL